MADEWYYTNQGQQKGPVTTTELKQLASTQQLQPSDLVWREGLAKWVPASSAKGLFPEAPGPATAVPAPAATAVPTPAAAPGPTPVTPIDEAADPDADLRPPRRRRDEDDYDDRPRRRRRDDDYDDYDDRPSRVRRRARGSSKGLIIGLVGGGVGLLVVVGVIILIIVLVSGGGSTTLTLVNGRASANGVLTNRDSFDRVRRSMHCQTYTVNLTGGKLYQIDMVSNQVDSYLRLEDSSGRQLAEDDDGGGFPNARIMFLCPQTGNYRISCTTFAPNMVGAYTLTVQQR